MSDTAAERPTRPGRARKRKPAEVSDVESEPPEGLGDQQENQQAVKQARPGRARKRKPAEVSDVESEPPEGLGDQQENQQAVKQAKPGRARKRKPAEVSDTEPELSEVPDDQHENERAAEVVITDSNGEEGEEDYVSEEEEEEDSADEEEDHEKRRERLRKVAEETKHTIPCLLTLLPQALPDGYYHLLKKLPALDPKSSPDLNTMVKVVEGDTFDTALKLASAAQFLDHEDTKPVCVLNMANAKTIGGGWENGAMAQEEELCFRSSLSFTLKKEFYPMDPLGAIYSPTVVVFRENMQRRHRFMDLLVPKRLPIVSVISMAATYKPDVTNAKKPKYKDPKDRELMKDKMRLILRIAATNEHRRLVLGALGCGVFQHPKQEVADCWLEVMNEKEFKGQFEAIVFAIYDGPQQKASGTGNFEIFHETLDGADLS